MRDLANNIDVAQSLAPAVFTTGTGTGTAVDLRGYDSAFVAASFGDWTDGTHTPSLEHSTDGTTFTDAGTDDALDGTFAAVLGTAGEYTTQRVGYTGGQRYVRAKLVSASASTGALACVNIVRGHPARKPLD